MTTPASEIERIVNSLIKLKETKSKEFIDNLEEYLEFRTNNKLLYETVLSNDMDMSIFKKMMSMKKKLEDGDDQYSVDVKFGQYMADKYLDPIVKKLPNHNLK
jgi:hypothetical protein